MIHKNSCATEIERNQVQGDSINEQTIWQSWIDFFVIFICQVPNLSLKSTEKISNLQINRKLTCSRN